MKSETISISSLIKEVKSCINTQPEIQSLTPIEQRSMKCISTTPETVQVEPIFQKSKSCILTQPEVQTIRLTPLQQQSCIELLPEQVSIVPIDSKQKLCIFTEPESVGLQKIRSDHVQCISIEQESIIIQSEIKQQETCIFTLPENQKIDQLQITSMQCLKVEPDKQHILTIQQNETKCIFTKPENIQISSVDAKSVQCFKKLPEKIKILPIVKDSKVCIQMQSEIQSISIPNQQIVSCIDTQAQNISILLPTKLSKQCLEVLPQSIIIGTKTKQTIQCIEMQPELLYIQPEVKQIQKCFISKPEIVQLKTMKHKQVKSCIETKPEVVKVEQLTKVSKECIYTQPELIEIMPILNQTKVCIDLLSDSIKIDQPLIQTKSCITTQPEQLLISPIKTKSQKCLHTLPENTAIIPIKDKTSYCIFTKPESIGLELTIDMESVQCIRMLSDEIRIDPLSQDTELCIFTLPDKVQIDTISKQTIKCLSTEPETQNIIPLLDNATHCIFTKAQNVPVSVIQGKFVQCFKREAELIKIVPLVKENKICIYTKPELNQVNAKVDQSIQCIDTKAQNINLIPESQTSKYCIEIKEIVQEVQEIPICISSKPQIISLSISYERFMTCQTLIEEIQVYNSSKTVQTRKCSISQPILFDPPYKSLLRHECQDLIANRQSIIPIGQYRQTLCILNNKLMMDQAEINVFSQLNQEAQVNPEKIIDKNEIQCVDIINNQILVNQEFLPKEETCTFKLEDQVREEFHVIVSNFTCYPKALKLAQIYNTDTQNDTICIFSRISNKTDVFNEVIPIESIQCFKKKDQGIEIVSINNEEKCLFIQPFNVPKSNQTSRTLSCLRSNETQMIIMNQSKIPKLCLNALPNTLKISYDLEIKSNCLTLQSQRYEIKPIEIQMRQCIETLGEKIPLDQIASQKQIYCTKVTPQLVTISPIVKTSSQCIRTLPETIEVKQLQTKSSLCLQVKAEDITIAPVISHQRKCIDILPEKVPITVTTLNRTICTSVKPEYIKTRTVQVQTKECFEVIAESIDINIIPKRTVKCLETLAEKQMVDSFEMLTQQCITMVPGDIIVDSLTIKKKKCIEVKPHNVTITPIEVSKQICIEVLPEQYQVVPIVKEYSRCIDMKPENVIIQPITIQGKQCILSREVYDEPIFVQKQIVRELCFSQNETLFAIKIATLNQTLTEQCKAEPINDYSLLYVDLKFTQSLQDCQDQSQTKTQLSFEITYDGVSDYAKRCLKFNPITLMVDIPQQSLTNQGQIQNCIIVEPQTFKVPFFKTYNPIHCKQILDYQSDVSQQETMPYYDQLLYISDDKTRGICTFLDFYGLSGKMKHLVESECSLFGAIMMKVKGNQLIQSEVAEELIITQRFLHRKENYTVTKTLQEDQVKITNVTYKTENITIIKETTDQVDKITIVNKTQVIPKKPKLMSGSRMNVTVKGTQILATKNQTVVVEPNIVFNRTITKEEVSNETVKQLEIVEKQVEIIRIKNTTAIQSDNKTIVETKIISEQGETMMIRKAPINVDEPEFIIYKKPLDAPVLEELIVKDTDMPFFKIQKRMAVDPCFVNEENIKYISQYEEVAYEAELREADIFSFETTIKLFNYSERFGEVMTEDHKDRTVKLALKPLEFYPECAKVSKYTYILKKLYSKLTLLKTNICYTKDYALQYQRDVNNISSDFKFNRSHTLISPAIISRDEFLESSGLLMRGIEDHTLCQQECDQFSQKVMLDQLNYLMVRFGSRKETLKDQEIYTIYRDNVTMMMHRYEPLIQKAPVQLNLKLNQHQNRSVNITFSNSQKYTNTPILINAIMFPNKTQCTRCECDGSKENSTVVSDLISLQLFTVTQDIQTQQLKVKPITDKDFKPSIQIDFGDLYYNSSEVKNSSILCASYSDKDVNSSIDYTWSNNFWSYERQSLTFDSRISNESFTADVTCKVEDFQNTIFAVIECEREVALAFAWLWILLLLLLLLLICCCIICCWCCCCRRKKKPESEKDESLVEQPVLPYGGLHPRDFQDDSYGGANSDPEVSPAMPSGGLIPRNYDDEEEGGGSSDPEESPAMPGGGIIPREFNDDEEGGGSSDPEVSPVMPGGGLVPRMYEDDEEGGEGSDPEDYPAMPRGGYIPRAYEMDEEGEELDSQLSSVQQDRSGGPYIPGLRQEQSSENSVPEFSASPIGGGMMGAFGGALARKVKKVKKLKKKKMSQMVGQAEFSYGGDEELLIEDEYEAEYSGGGMMMAKKKKKVLKKKRAMQRASGANYGGEEELEIMTELVSGAGASRGGAVVKKKKKLGGSRMQGFEYGEEEESKGGAALGQGMFLQQMESALMKRLVQEGKQDAIQGQTQFQDAFGQFFSGQIGGNIAEEMKSGTTVMKKKKKKSAQARQQFQDLGVETEEELQMMQGFRSSRESGLSGQVYQSKSAYGEGTSSRAYQLSRGGMGGAGQGYQSQMMSTGRGQGYQQQQQFVRMSDESAGGMQYLASSSSQASGMTEGQLQQQQVRRVAKKAGRRYQQKETEDSEEEKQKDPRKHKK